MSDSESKYLTAHDWGAENALPNVFSYEGLLEYELALSPRVLIDSLRKAQDFLETTPGPNQDVRSRLAETWLGYWIDFLTPLRDNYLPQEDYVNTAKVKAYDRLVTRPLLGTSFGGLFVAGLEGHEGHRFAVNRIQELGEQWAFSPILVFEQDEYFDRYKDRKPFLPLEVRLSLWQYYLDRGYVTVSPFPSVEVPLNEHYANLAKSLNLAYCFSDEEDPNVLDKVRRGYMKDLRFKAVLPHLRTVSTSGLTKRLLPDIDLNLDTILIKDSVGVEL
jgi:hypothetical protein